MLCSIVISTVQHDMIEKFMDGVVDGEMIHGPVPYELCHGFPVPFPVRGEVPSARKYWPLWIPRANLYQQRVTRGFSLMMPLDRLKRLNNRVPGQLRTVELATSVAKKSGEPPRELMLLAALVGGINSGMFEPHPAARDIHTVACDLAERTGVSTHPRLWMRRTWRTLPNANFGHFTSVKVVRDAGRAAVRILAEVLATFMPARMYLMGPASDARYEAKVVQDQLSDVDPRQDTISPIDWVVMQRTELAARVWEKPLEDLAEDWGVSGPMVGKACTRMRIKTPPWSYWKTRKENRRPLLGT